LAVAYERLTNIKRDFLHKLTTELVRTYSAIGLESLKITNMLKNHSLAKHIAGANWGMFKQMLINKCQQYAGCVLVFADPFFPSSRLCSSCGHKYGQLTLKERAWSCASCGTHHDRDVNAARNLEKLANDWKSAYQAKEKGYAVVSGC
jgi:putative transposase